MTAFVHLPRIEWSEEEVEDISGVHLEPEEVLSPAVVVGHPEIQVVADSVPAFNTSPPMLVEEVTRQVVNLSSVVTVSPPDVVPSPGSPNVPISSNSSTEVRVNKLPVSKFKKV